MSKKPFDKGKALTAGVIIILILIFVVLFWYGLNKVLAMEGSFPPNELVEGVIAAPETAEEASSLLKKSFDEAAELKPQLSRSDSFDINGGFYESEFSDNLNVAVDYILDDLESKLEEDFEGFTSEFGEAFPEKTMIPDVTAADLEPYEYYICETCGARSESPCDICGDCSSESPNVKKSVPVFCDYIYYECSSCGETSRVPLENCEPCGSVYPYIMKYRDEYEITLEVKESALEKLFAPISKEDAVALLGDELDDTIELNNFDISYDKLQIFYKINRLSGKISYLEYRKIMTVEADVTFIGDFAALGDNVVIFNVNESNRFNFIWPGLSLNNHEMVIEPKATDNLLATLTCTDPTKPVVTWTSSDESVLTVDDEGYIKGGKEPGTATVTASFEFNGVTYTDSCIVNVRIPVESVALNKRKAKIDVGEEVTFTPKFSPSDASVQTVKWYTEDEKIASVDTETGLVKGVSKGTVTVYALSDDGYFKSSCEVTVE